MNTRGFSIVWFLIIITVAVVGGLLYWQNSGKINNTNEPVGIVGNWQAVDDHSVLVTYNADGSVVDYYDGALMSTSKWSLINDDSGETLVVQHSDDTYKYKILKVDTTTMELTYLGRGNTLKYKRLSDEEAFNLSGRAKAYDSGESASAGGLLEYADTAAGISFTYPDYVDLVDKRDVGSANIEMSVEVTALRDVQEEDTLGFDKKTVLANKKALQQGEYGSGVDMAIKDSERLREIGDSYAQDMLVLGRFEVCDVRFERKLYFFSNNYQVLITVYGPKDMFVSELPRYFTTDDRNCARDQIWDFSKQAIFYDHLTQGSVPDSVSLWYDVIDDIVTNITLYTVDN